MNKIQTILLTIIATCALFLSTDKIIERFAQKAVSAQVYTNYGDYYSDSTKWQATLPTEGYGDLFKIEERRWYSLEGMGGEVFVVSNPTYGYKLVTVTGHTYVPNDCAFLRGYQRNGYAEFKPANREKDESY